MASSVEAEVERMWCESWVLPAPILVSEHADATRILDSRTAAEPGPWRTARVPHTRGPMDAFVLPFVREISLMFCAQGAKTEIQYNTLNYLGDQDPCPVMIVKPDQKSARKTSKKRLQPMIRLSLALKDRIQTRRGRKDDMDIEEISLDRMDIVFAWSGSPSSLAEFPIRVVYTDEVDKFSLFAGKDAAPEDLAIARQRTFWNSKLVRASTPTTQHGIIYLAWLDSLQFEYLVPCPHCGEYQIMIFDQVKWPQDERDPKIIEAQKLAWYECVHCQGKIVDLHKPWMIGNGVWIAAGPKESGSAVPHQKIIQVGQVESSGDRPRKTGQSLSGAAVGVGGRGDSPRKTGQSLSGAAVGVGGSGDSPRKTGQSLPGAPVEQNTGQSLSVVGPPAIAEMFEEGDTLFHIERAGVRRAYMVEGAAPKQRHLGFHAACFIMPWENLNFSACAAAFLKAKGNRAKLMEVVNQWWAEPFIETAQSTDTGKLSQHKSGYGRGRLPDWVKLLTAAIDVQEDRFFITIMGWGSGMTAGVIDAYPAFADTLTREAYDKLIPEIFGMKYPYIDSQYGDLSVTRAGIDSGYRTTAVYEACRRHRFLYPTKGADTNSALHVDIKKLDKFPDGKIIPGGLIYYRLNVDMLKSDFHQRLKIPPDHAGYLFLPADIGDDFLSQLASEHQVPRSQQGTARLGGQIKYIWVLKRSGLANHYLDCTIIQYALAEIFRFRNIPDSGPGPPGWRAHHKPKAPTQKKAGGYKIRQDDSSWWPRK